MDDVELVGRIREMFEDEAGIERLKTTLQQVADEVDQGVMHPEVKHPDECPVCKAVRIIRSRADETE